MFIIKLYKIGEVSKIVGVSTDLIRYYEEKGIITPQKNPNTGYRYYDAWDINFLLDCVWYKNFGFSIEEIVNIEWKSTYSSLLERFHTMEDSLATQIHKQELLLKRLKSQRESLEKVMVLLDKCEIANAPEFIYYLNRHNSDYQSDDALHQITKEWVKLMPLTKRYFEVSDSTNPTEDYSWGFSLDSKYAAEFNVNVKEPVKKRTSVKTLHSAFKSSGKNAFSPKHIDYMYKYAKKNGYIPCGNAFGTLVCSILDDGKLTGFFEVWLPIDDK